MFLLDYFINVLLHLSASKSSLFIDTVKYFLTPFPSNERWWSNFKGSLILVSLLKKIVMGTSNSP